MTVYAETSAVLAWLLDESAGARVGPFLRPPARVVVSHLTLIECDRILLRLARQQPGRSADIEALRARLASVAVGWAVEPVAGSVVDRARASFPDDSIRSLDAIHLATAIVVAASVPDLEVLSLDERVRANAVALGLHVLPA
jgi:predicted nucleic acid-binding protein